MQRLYCGSQWSPVLSTGITARLPACHGRVTLPQWSPVLSTGITGDAEPLGVLELVSRNGARSYRPGSPASWDATHGEAEAAMEPGLIDRDHPDCSAPVNVPAWPQWSPVLSTGITCRRSTRRSSADS